MQFNIDNFENINYDDLKKDSTGKVIGCDVIDDNGYKAFVRNIIWKNSKPASWFLQDKENQPTEILVMAKDSNGKAYVLRTLTNFTYNENGKATSFLKTTISGQQFWVTDIEYNAKDQMQYCKQKEQSGIVREYYDFIYNDKGEFVNCQATVLKTGITSEISNTMLNNILQETDIDKLLKMLFTEDSGELNPEEKEQILQSITNIVQILNAIKNNAVDQSVNNLERNDILSPKYKLSTPLLQVFYSKDSMEESLIGEKNLSLILEIIKCRILGAKIPENTNHVILKIADNLTNCIMEKVFIGNYKISQNGKRILNLGFNLGAKDQTEAIEYAMMHLYYNSSILLNEKEIMQFHYKKLDNFILVNL